MHCKSYSHFFSKKYPHICVSLDVNFNKSLTYEVVSFEQLGPCACFSFFRYGRNIPRYDFVGSEQCDIIEDGCEQYMVKKDDHRLDCFTGERLLNDINKDYDSSLQSLLDLFLRTQKL